MPEHTKTTRHELNVFISSRDARCDECGEQLGHHAWITLQEGKRAVCLICSDLDHLVFLPSGDAALARRARKHSRLSAVVLKWSRSRKRYGRQGVLVESEAVERAEQECVADAAVREARKTHAAVRRAELDRSYMTQFAARIREIYRYCPTGREQVIAEHACRKYSGRVGRSAAAKALCEEAVRLSVLAHVRHFETLYDDLLLQGYERHDARRRVQAQVTRVLAQWEQGSSGLMPSS